MQIELLQREGVVVLALQGAIDRTAARELERSLTERFESGDRRFVVDFSGVPGVDGSGLRALLAFGGKLERCGAMILSSLNESVQHQLETSGLRSAFRIEVLTTEAVQRAREVEIADAGVSALTAEVSRLVGARRRIDRK